MQKLYIKICPVCTVVSLIWLSTSAGIVMGFLDYESWKLVIAISMGGTVVGISSKAEEKFNWHNPIVKLLLIIVGFLLAYFAIININAWTLAAETVIILVFGYLFFISGINGSVSVADSKKIKELEKKLKNCC